MTDKEGEAEVKIDKADGSISSSPEGTEETSVADEGKETSSGIEVEASDASLSLTGDEATADDVSTVAHTGRKRRGSRREKDLESSDEEEEEDSDSMDDTGRYSINDDNNNHDRSNSDDDDDDENKMEEEEGGDDESLRRRRRRHPAKRSSTERDKDSSDEERALEDWVTSGVQDLPRPSWYSILALRERQLGRGLHFIYDACGSRSFVQRFKMQYSLEKHNGCVNTLHFNQHGTWLASGSDDLKVVIWDWVYRRPALEFDSGHKSNVFQAKFLPNSGDSTLAMCARDGQVRVAELSVTQRCKTTKKVAQHKGASHKLAVEPDSPCTFLSAGEDAVVFSIDLRQERPATISIHEYSFEEADNFVMGDLDSETASSSVLDFGSDALHTERFCTGYGKLTVPRYLNLLSIFNPTEDPAVIYLSKTASVRQFTDVNPIFSDKDGKSIYTPAQINSSSKANVTCLVYSYNGAELLASYNDEDIYLFDSSHSDGAEFTQRYKGHRNNATVKGVNFYGPKSEYVVSGSDCGHIFLWDKSSCQIVQFMDGDKGGVVNCLEPHPHLPVLATSGLDHDVKIWAPTSETPTGLNGLKETIKKNKRERDDDSLNHSDLFDSHMLWFLMRHLRQGRHRRHRHDPAAGGDADSDDSSMSSDTLDDDDEGPDRVQCMPS
ncbi:DDB1- and CUL4-associated factor 8 [Protopterus annectens]|uniref:DDB1- and CUL4-associated factor 8 n=1 Tax=Protopterus annectens TaxID=7888 RepID=UPI001CFB00E5|nr:DDB1- and CUL4-associated factor 8 [Protopterus annectens]